MIEYGFNGHAPRKHIVGDLGNGEYILDVKELGLDLHLCLDYVDDTEMIYHLLEVEKRYSYKFRHDETCNCVKIAKIREHREPFFQTIDIAVKRRFA